jgi:site-specific DNA-methyltransferase (adenine-specific)
MDNMEYMSGIEDNYFDLAIVDPEYENGTNAEKGTGEYSKKKFKKNEKSWDSKRASKQYFIELLRISKNQVIFGGQFFANNLPICRGWCCWYKTDELKGRDFSEFELLYTSFNKPTRLISIKPFIRNNTRIHPTQKPVALYKWLLTNYAKPNDKIFDSHVGSGSIRIACHELGFDFEGCELDKDYYNDQEKRYQEWLKQYNNEFYIGNDNNNLFGNVND